MKKVAINGFGRIGRATLKAYMHNAEYQKAYEVVAINDLTDPATLVHLYKYDSLYGKEEASLEGDCMVINGKKIKLTAERNPEDLPWKELGVDIVLESTGFFRTRETMEKHIKAGAKKVLLSAPAAKATDVDLTTVIGVNDDKITKDMVYISNASCTTNSMAGVTKVINDNFKIISGTMTTVHSYTGDQRLLDAPHKDLRRARAAAVNMIPTSTGAAKAIGLVIPDLAGKLDGVAIRVPTPVGSITDMTFQVEKEASVETVNEAIEKATKTYLKESVKYNTDPIVLSDIVGDPHSSVFDAPLTKVMDKHTVKVFSWYDNEWGFSNRYAHLAAIVAKLD